MTSHAPAIDIGHDQPRLPNQHFSSWLRGQTALFISQIVAILGFVSFLASLVYYVSHLSEHGELLRPATVKLVVDYAHVVFMAVFILVLIRVLDDNERGSYRVKLVHERVFGKHRGDYERRLQTSKKQLKKFKRLFLLFWIGMLFLYVSFACQHSYQLSTSEPEEKSAHIVDLSFSATGKSADGISVAGTSHGDGMETVKDAESLVVVGRTYAPKLLTIGDVYKQLALPFVVFFFNNLTLLFIFWCFLVMCIPSDRMDRDYRKARNISALIMLLLTLLFLVLVPVKFRLVGVFTADDCKAYSAIFDALSGVVNAIVLALLVARLDSKLVGLPSWLISILYSYAAVQPLFMVFELSQSMVLAERIAPSVLIFVFVSKIYFFLIIMYALQTGKMLNYLFCFPILRDRAVERRKPRRKLTTLSGWLSSDQPITISKWLGAAAICYFFISLVGLQLISNGDPAAPSPTGSAFVISSILRPPDVLIDYLQLAAVSAMMVTLFLVRKENRYGGLRALRTAEHIFEETLKPRYPPKEGKNQLKKFKRFFLYFWCAMFLLYIIFLLQHLKIVFFSCVKDGTEFHYLFQPHVLKKEELLCEQGSFAFMIQILFYPFLVFLFATLNFLFVFWCFVILRSPAFDTRAEAKQNLLINYSSFVVALLIAAFSLLLFMIGGPTLSENNLKDYATVFDGVTGTLSAVVLALLIARMDSKLFSLRTWLIGMLFTYASIQPLFVAFSLNVEVLEMVKTAVLTSALLLKICLFLIVAHSLQSGKVLNYLVCFPFLRERVDSIFENQFEIKLASAEHDSFTFSILKKNLPHYSTSKRFKNREEGDRFVHRLRGRMKNKDAYLTNEESGTYWVALRSPDGELFCESIPLRSEDDARDLIEESIDKVPYCKYNRT